MTLVDLLLGGLAVVAGGVAAVAGFGIGSILTPALATVVGTKVAVAAIALPHAIATALRLWAMRDSIDREVLKSFGLASAAGGLAGASLHAITSSPWLSMALGALLIAGGALELTGRARELRFRGPWAIVAGLASGAFGGLVGNQGGIRSAALLRFNLPPRALVATATASALLVDAARMPVYVASSGPDVARIWPTIAVLTVGVVIGTLFGAPLLRRLPDALFLRLLSVLLILLGLSLIAGLGR